MNYKEKLEKIFKEKLQPDVVALNVPLLIRLFEYFNEGNFEDKELHFIVERMLGKLQNNPLLSMEDYEELINPPTIE